MQLKVSVWFVGLFEHATYNKYVDCTINQNVQVDKKLKPGVRVTVEMTKSKKSSEMFTCMYMYVLCTCM